MTEKKATKSKSAAVSGQVSGQIKVTQIGSPIGRSPDQRQTLIGLGLNKMHKVRLLENTVSVMGMVNKVKHLVKFEIV